MYIYIYWYMDIWSTIETYIRYTYIRVSDGISAPIEVERASGGYQSNREAFRISLLQDEQSQIETELQNCPKADLYTQGDWFSSEHLLETMGKLSPKTKEWGIPSLVPSPYESLPMGARARRWEANPSPRVAWQSALRTRLRWASVERPSSWQCEKKTQRTNKSSIKKLPGGNQIWQRNIRYGKIIVHERCSVAMFDYSRLLIWERDSHTGASQPVFFIAATMVGKIPQ